jgi:plastocyanin
VGRKTVGLVGAAVIALSCASGVARAANNNVSIQNFSFQPSNVNVSVGDTVTWTQKDAGTQHTVTSDNGAFGSANLATGQTFAHTFDQAGTFAYHCNIHPSMTATVTVQGAVTPPATSPPTAAPAPAPAATTAPRPAPTTTTRPPPTTAPPTTAAPTTTTLAPPAAADTGTTSSTTGRSGDVALRKASKSDSSSHSRSPWVLALAVALVAGAAAGGVALHRRAV